MTESIRQYAGDSRGRWEGDTLVVETTHFNDHAFIRNFNSNLSQALQVVERSEGPMFEYACHEGNYGLTNMLAGSHTQERADGNR